MTDEERAKAKLEYFAKHTNQEVCLCAACCDEWSTSHEVAN